MIKSYIYVTLQKEFIHQYKDAPDEVSYLRYPHRHIAHIKVMVEVFHNDREIEFIILKHKLEDFIEINKISNSSCEQIADNIYGFIQKTYGTNRGIEITVSEDNENGAIIRYEPRYE